MLVFTNYVSIIEGKKCFVKGRRNLRSTQKAGMQGAQPLAGGSGVSPELFSLLLFASEGGSYEWMSGEGMGCQAEGGELCGGLFWCQVVGRSSSCPVANPREYRSAKEGNRVLEKEWEMTKDFQCDLPLEKGIAFQE